MKFKPLFAQMLVAGLMSLPVMQSQATTINNALVSGVQNTLEDQDREAYVDANRDGLLSVGDVFVGFLRLDNFQPGSGSFNNGAYAVISNQITAVDTTGLKFSLGPTTAMGLRLQDITGDTNTVGGMFAVYDSAPPYGTDLINTSAPGAVSIKGDIDYIINNGTLRLVTGIVSPDNYLVVTNNPPFAANSPNSQLASLPTSITTGSFGGGLDIIYNNTNFLFSDSVLSINPLTSVLVSTPLVIKNGAVSGAVGDAQSAIFSNIGTGYGTYQQCLVGGASAACGFTTDADFVVAPVSVPEPGTLALMGITLLGMGAARRRVTKG